MEQYACNQNKLYGGIKMYKLLIMYHQPEDREAWDDHYYNIHLPLAKQIPLTTSLTINKDLSITPMAGENPYYLIAEMTWNSKEDMEKALQSEEGHASHDDFESFAKDKVTMIGYEVEEVPLPQKGKA
jgi:uncharacterized protein (TIGR02118 family)